jgi:hypothetical protein
LLAGVSALIARVWKVILLLILVGFISGLLFCISLGEEASLDICAAAENVYHNLKSCRREYDLKLYKVSDSTSSICLITAVL